MAYIGVHSESDMELAIDYTIEVAQGSSPTKVVTLVFNTEGMMEIFMANLFEEFEIKQVSKNSGLHLNLHIPEETNE